MDSSVDHHKTRFNKKKTSRRAVIIIVRESFSIFMETLEAIRQLSYLIARVKNRESLEFMGVLVDDSTRAGIRTKAHLS